MSTSNESFILNLKMDDVPWQRLTSAYGRCTDFPKYFATMDRMESLKNVKDAYNTIRSSIEHQETLWHVTPFAMVFLCRDLDKCFKVLQGDEKNLIAHQMASILLEDMAWILECYSESLSYEHDDPVPNMSDLIDEEVLFPVDEEDDDELYEDEGGIIEELFFSFYYYTWLVAKTYESIFDQKTPPEFASKIAKVKKFLEPQQ